MSLKNLIKKEAVGVFDFPGIEGFKVTLKHMDKEEMKRVYDTCTVKRYNMKTKAYDVDFQPERFKKYLAENIIKTWDGLTYERLNKLVVLDTEKLKDAGIKPADLFEATDENKIELLDSSVDFDNWVSDMIKEVQNFAEEQKKKEFENLN